MRHFSLSQQTATFGRSDERRFVVISHEYNSSIQLYCPLNKTIITHHSYWFLDIVDVATSVYVISDDTLAMNALLSENFGPTSTADHSLPYEEVGSKSNADTAFPPEKAGPTNLTATFFNLS